MSGCYEVYVTPNTWSSDHVTDTRWHGVEREKIDEYSVVSCGHP